MRGRPLIKHKQALFLSAALFIGNIPSVVSTAKGELDAKTEIQKVERRFLKAMNRSLNAELPRLKEEYGDDFVPKLRILFTFPMADYRQSGRWLFAVGYALGTAPGNGLIAINRLSFVDTEGQTVVSIDEKYGGDSATVFPVTDKLQGLMVSGDSGRPYNGWVVVISVEAKPRVLWEYRSPATTGWYSKVHVEHHADQTCLLVDRTVRDFEKLKKFREFERFKFNKETNHFDFAEQLSEKAFKSALDAAKKSDSYTVIDQEGVPYDEDWDKGK